MNSQYTVYFDGHFSHRLEVTAPNEDDAQTQAYLTLMEMMEALDDWEATNTEVEQPPLYTPLKDFYTNSTPYTSLKDFYTPPYTPLH